MQRFEDNRYYLPRDDQMRVLASETTLAIWRCKRIGPRYAKVGGRIIYLGADLNRYIDENTVEPAPA